MRDQVICNADEGAMEMKVMDATNTNGRHRPS
jgi:hypothetical protein